MILVGETELLGEKVLQCHFFSTVCVTWLSPVPAWSKAYLGPLAFSDFSFECCWEHGYLFAASVVCCQGRDLCDVLITRPEESYRLCVCVCVCVHVIECDMVQQ
jgi:hypothetical protein